MHFLFLQEVAHTPELLISETDNKDVARHQTSVNLNQYRLYILYTFSMTITKVASRSVAFKAPGMSEAVWRVKTRL